LVTSIRPKERVKKGKERIEERGGNVGGLWLNHDREKRTAIEELEGAEHSGLFGRARSRRRAKGKSFVQSRWSLRESLIKAFLSVRLACSTLPED
jgi:hypothetical protein